MGPFEMVVAIVAIAVIGGVIKERAKHARNAPPAEPQETARLNAEIRSLRERVAVLERVITDNEGSLRLDHEIERLRDRSAKE